MQRQVNELRFSSGNSDASRRSGEILGSIKFLRLSGWEECRRSTALSGDVSCCGQIFKRFRLRADLDVTLDFWHRGFKVDSGTASAFRRLLSHAGVKKALDRAELRGVSDILGPVSGAFAAEESVATVILQSAEVRELNHRSVLIVFWTDTVGERSFVSVFVDAESDGTRIDEIHFSAPVASIEDCAEAIADTLDSIQWNVAIPPPVPGLSVSVI
ncbi:MAG: hypothetical protein KC777_20960 [Cyanobacteria bacterium HKST-UBA02]|nr:hypothetical protein [Cyanobacteria bacterium HKST-UBA02]